MSSDGIYAGPFTACQITEYMLAILLNFSASMGKDWTETLTSSAQ